LANDPGSFTWYELITTDVTAAATFYRDVVGWGVKPASTSQMSYALFTATEVPTAGLMELPEAGRKMGAAPRWMGYVAVGDVHAAADRIRRLGGAVHVPPTETNIGQISVVADPSAAIFAVVDRLQVTAQPPADFGKLGRVGWHELFAADLDREATFYCDLFGWQKADADQQLVEDYVSFSAGGRVIGGAFKKRPDEPVPFWLFYFNVEDLDAAAERVRAGGGRAFVNNDELPGGLWVARCSDPQGAEWQGFSSRGQLVAPNPQRKSEN
jgi:predicted enzyme related to lactoylglutathione lyase